ncbi:hypothetical protein J3A83DRAFT_4190201 [Scleroderma citrinum]
MISGQEVEMFCGVIGNQNKAYKLAHMSAIKAPMDFAIVTSCCFTNFKNTFETVDEPDYVVKLLDDAAVGVVQLKEWLAWEAESQPVKAGVTPHMLPAICVQQGKLCARLCSDDRNDITLEPGITSLLECFGDLVSGPDDTAIHIVYVPSCACCSIVALFDMLGTSK